MTSQEALLAKRLPCRIIGLVCWKFMYSCGTTCAGPAIHTCMRAHWHTHTHTHTHTHMMHMCTHVQTQYIHTNGCTYLSTSMKDILFSVQWDVGPCACHNLMLYAFCCIVGILLFFFFFFFFCFFFCFNRTRSKERGRKTRQWVVTFRLLGLVRPNLPLGNCQWISVCRPQDWTMTVSKRARKTNNIVEEADWESCAGIWFPDSLIQLKHICTDKFNHQIVLEKLWKLHLKA